MKILTAEQKNAALKKQYRDEKGRVFWKIGHASEHYVELHCHESVDVVISDFDDLWPNLLVTTCSLQPSIGTYKVLAKKMIYRTEYKVNDTFHYDDKQMTIANINQGEKP